VSAAERRVSGANELTVDSVVVASTQQVACEVQTETVVLSLRNGEYFGLNDVGTAIWRVIQEPCTVAELRDRLLEQYSGIGSEECENEVLKFLRRAVTLELINAS
jgi:hypothetical protein